MKIKTSKCNTTLINATELARFFSTCVNADSSTIGGAVWKMGSKTIVDVSQIEETIKNIPKDSFTVLDFIEAFRKVYPEDWGRLVEGSGLFGTKRRYTVATYFSNRLDVYSQKDHSIPLPFIRYKEGKFKDYRRTTEDEERVFGSPWTAMYRKVQPNNEEKLVDICSLSTLLNGSAGSMLGYMKIYLALFSHRVIG